MKVSGFTFIRNAVRLDYPIVEAITSILPICDEFIVMVGNSDDETRQLIESINSPKIRIYDSTWDESLRSGGRVLAVETNKAFSKIATDTNWAFYIQGDEVMHEDYLQVLRDAMLHYLNDDDVEGLLLKYLHFYGSYDFVGDSARWYRKEIRIVKYNQGITSFRDAQGFRKNDRLIRVKAVDAVMHHYGWVKPPEKQQEKQQQFHRLWHNDEKVKVMVGTAQRFDYSSIDSLARFSGSHPGVMKSRIQQKNWKFDFDPTKKKLSLKSRFKQWVERKTGWRIGEYKNYKLIR